MTGSPGWIGVRVTSSWGWSCQGHQEGPSLGCLKVGSNWRRRHRSCELSQSEPEEPQSDGHAGREGRDALWW